MVALYLVPFAGLAFLWFIGAVRDRIGAAEDRFFATVFLGTGLLFVAMLFIAAALAGGLLETEANRQGRSRQKSGDSAGIPATRCSPSTRCAWRARSQSSPRRSVTGSASSRGGSQRSEAVGVVLLLTVESFAWVEILFPLWVLILSIHLLLHPPAFPLCPDRRSCEATPSRDVRPWRRAAICSTLGTSDEKGVVR